jgi:hypothetical protein
MVSNKNENKTELEDNNEILPRFTPLTGLIRTAFPRKIAIIAMFRVYKHLRVLISVPAIYLFLL